MKPIIILPPGQMSKEDIEKLRANDLCVVVVKDPRKVKFVDPIPAASSRTEIENAAIQLSRCLLNANCSNTNLNAYHGEISKLYMYFLMRGTPLDLNGTQEEKERHIFDVEKAEELKRLARAEAKADRAAAKEKKE